MEQLAVVVRVRRLVEVRMGVVRSLLLGRVVGVGRGGEVVWVGLGIVVVVDGGRCRITRGSGCLWDRGLILLEAVLVVAVLAAVAVAASVVVVTVGVVVAVTVSVMVVEDMLMEVVVLGGPLCVRGGVDRARGVTSVSRRGRGVPGGPCAQSVRKMKLGGGLFLVVEILPSTPPLVLLLMSPLLSRRLGLSSTI